MSLLRRFIFWIFRRVFNEEEMNQNCNSDYFYVEHNVHVMQNIKKVPLKDLARMVYYDHGGPSGETPMLQFVDNKIFTYTLINGKYGDSEKFTIWETITEVYYADVEEGFKKFVYFDDVHEIFEYTNDVRDCSIRGPGTCVIPILHNNDIIGTRIMEKINEMESEYDISTNLHRDEEP